MTRFQGANPFDSLTPATKKIVIACGLVYLLQMVFPEILQYGALTPSDVLHKFYIWQLFTYSFLHGGFFHLFINMFALWMFGPPIESYWGPKRFTIYYFVCTAGAAIAQAILAPTSPVVGASGAIYGLLLAFGFLFPDAVIYLFFVFPMRAMQAVLVIALMTFAFSVDSGGSRVAHFAHLGGMLTGLLYLRLPVWMSRMRFWKGVPNFHRSKTPQFTVIQEDDLSARVDRILEKISSQGVGSLTQEEHETMRRYSEKKS